jgi:hypothetical protein
MKKTVIYCIIGYCLYITIIIVWAAPYDSQLRDFPPSQQHCTYYPDGDTYICQDMDDVPTAKNKPLTETEKKIKSAQECVRLAGIAKNVQQGRRTHHDQWRDFMAKVPRWLDANGLTSGRVLEAIGVAKVVFQMPEVWSPQNVFYEYYKSCASINNTIIIDGVEIEIDANAIYM